MTPEEIERLSLEELQRMADDPQTGVPEEFPARLQEMACAACLAEKGTESLADRPGSAASGRRPVHWLRGAVPAAALAALACFLLLPRLTPQPKDTFTDPQLAYAELTRALSLFEEALQTGSADAAAAFSELGQPFAEIQENR